MDDKERIERLEKDVETLKSTLSRYQGFIGGIVFLVTCVFAFLELFGKKLGL